MYLLDPQIGKLHQCVFLCVRWACVWLVCWYETPEWSHHITAQHSIWFWDIPTLPPDSEGTRQMQLCGPCVFLLKPKGGSRDSLLLLGHTNGAAAAARSLGVLATHTQAARHNTNMINQWSMMVNHGWVGPPWWWRSRRLQVSYPQKCLRPRWALIFFSLSRSSLSLLSRPLASTCNTQYTRDIRKKHAQDRRPPPPNTHECLSCIWKTISLTSMEDHTNMCPSDLLRWTLQCCWLVFIVSIQLSGPRTPLIPSDSKCFHLIYSLK